MQLKPVNLLLSKFTHWLMSNSLFGDSPAMLFHFLLEGREKQKSDVVLDFSLTGYECHQCARLLRSNNPLQPVHPTSLP